MTGERAEINQRVIFEITYLPGKKEPIKTVVAEIGTKKGEILRRIPLDVADLIHCRE